MSLQTTFYKPLVANEGELELTDFSLSTGIARNLDLEHIKLEYIKLELTGAMKTIDPNDSSGDKYEKLFISPSDFDTISTLAVITELSESESKKFIMFRFPAYTMNEEGTITKESGFSVRIFVCNWQKSSFRDYLKGDVVGPVLTEDILEEVFPGTSAEIRQQVAEAVNKYKDHFEINTVERMSHFLGQTGHETGGFISLFERPDYTPRQIVDIYPQAKYGHLYEKAIFNENSRNYDPVPVYFNVNVCEIDPHASNTFRQLTDRTEGSGRSGATNREELFPYLDGKQVANAYGSVKSVKHTITINGQEHHYYKFPDELRTDIIPEGSKKTGEKSNMTTKIPNENYIEGLIKVKQEYVGNPELFDVVYACRMGNSNIASKEGSLFAGLGLIHITGKYWYYEISREWNKDPVNATNKKYFYKKKIDGGHYEELFDQNNYDVAVKASMYYWKIQKINAKCDVNDDAEVTRLVNGGATGSDDRKKYTEQFFEQLKK